MAKSQKLQSLCLEVVVSVGLELVRIGVRLAGIWLFFGWLLRGPPGLTERGTTRAALYALSHSPVSAPK